MSKKLISLLLVLVMLVGVFASCRKPNDGDGEGNEGTDTPACSHTYTNGCDTTCNKCNAVREVAPCADENGDDLCDICGTNLACEHEWESVCDTTCDKCGSTREVPHEYDNACDTTCNLCNAERTVGEHKDGAEGVYDAVCDVCGATIEIPDILSPEANAYTYNDAVVTLASNWNPHTYQVADDSYPISYITTGLYGFFFNEDFDGYVIKPEMAAADPVDVTEAIKASHPNFNIPESETSGYAYKIALNPNAKWATGETITADDYIYSMQQLLNPEYLNYRATDYYAQNFSIAGAEEYANQGQTLFLENALNAGYEVADLVKDANGNYTTPDGNPVYVAVDRPLEDWLGGNSLADYVGAYGEAYFNMSKWDSLYALVDDEGLVVLNDSTLDMLVTTISTTAWGEDASNAPSYFYYSKTYGAFDWDDVGIFKSGEFEITLVLAKSLAGFDLFYNLTGNWLVYEEYYEDGKHTDANGVYFNDYNTTLELTNSYGPYKMTQFQADKFMVFERNENWFGYTDGKHTYVHPEDGETYDMYQTSRIYCQVVPERITRKLMFLKGRLMGFGLGSEDFEEYRNSDRTYVSPSETVFFLILNGHKDMIAEREKADNFDQTKNDLETMTLLSFRKAMAVTFDKEAMCTAVSPADSGGYGLFGEAYIYDPVNGLRYRDTVQAKKALCEFYSVDVEGDFNGDLDAAVESITGYDPETAKELFGQAYTEAIEAGYITDTDNNGKSDQTIEIVYAISTDSNFYTKLLDYMNEKLSEVLSGTPFENKIKFVKSAPLNTEWSNKLKGGEVDTVLGGWSGSALNPYSCTDLYTNPSYQYDAKWFNAATITKTLTIDGEEVTLNLKQWSDALNGATVTVTVGEGDAAVEKSYNFGDGKADVEVRLEILAMIEVAILGTYDYIPMLQEGSMALLSHQVYYVIEEYNSVMGRGGMTYMRYNYDDAEWAAFVASQGGTLRY